MIDTLIVMICMGVDTMQVEMKPNTVPSDATRIEEASAIAAQKAWDKTSKENERILCFPDFKTKQT